MIPVEIRMALWNLMDEVEKSRRDISEEDRRQISLLLVSLDSFSTYILAQQRATTKEA